jgi:hypothetical protein
MSQLLDLTITLTLPGESQSEAIATIALNCAELGLNHTGDLLNDPLTQQDRNDLRWYLEEYWKWPYEGFAQRAKGVEELLPKLGKRLYESVFGSREADRIVQKWLATEGEHQISIISDIPHALSLPWELLHSEQGYLVMRTQEPVSILVVCPKVSQPPLQRHLSRHYECCSSRRDRRGQVLSTHAALHVNCWMRYRGRSGQGRSNLSFCAHLPPTLKALRKRLRDGKRQIHVLHFDGHGSFDEKIGKQDEPRYGFSGRAYELLQIERFLLREQLVVIHGFGGVGKTALVRETADWLTRTKMYDAASFVSFEHGGDAATLLSALGTFLDVYDGHYNPNDTSAAVAKVALALKQKRTLVIADNLESILPGGDAPVEAAIRTQLWDVLLKLSQMGAGVLLTTRDTAFGDGRLAQGKYVAHLVLQGLYPEDAYLLASRLLEYLGIDRAKAPYAELRELLKQLDYHPLAMQLVLPALGASSLTLAQVKADFSSLLPRFQDDLETGRNRSLLASLDYSLRRLSEAQRALLPRLALFEGGAREDDLLAITEIAEPEWVKLRPALEQAALLTAEQVGGFTAPFLHFHPVLAPYLRSQPGADDPALRARYAQQYADLANYLYREDNRHPQEVRALAQKELPNLRRALELLLETGELDAASVMVTSMPCFWTTLGCCASVTNCGGV